MSSSLVVQLYQLPGTRSGILLAA